MPFAIYLMFFKKFVKDINQDLHHLLPETNNNFQSL